MKDIIKLDQEKADAMGVKLVISKYYDELIQEDYELRELYKQKEGFIYVSKSKNGVQYIDYLQGQNSSEYYVKAEIYM